MIVDHSKSKSKELLDWMRRNNLDDYGSIIMGEDVRRVLGITMPEVGTRRDFDAVAMDELSGVDYCRNALLGEGKYLSMIKGNYRILLPSENAAQVESYMRSAENKLKRGLKLHRNTSAGHVTSKKDTQSRLVMRLSSIKEGRESAGLMK